MIFLFYADWLAGLWGDSDVWGSWDTALYYVLAGRNIFTDKHVILLGDLMLVKGGIAGLGEEQHCFDWWIDCTLL